MPVTRSIVQRVDALEKQWRNPPSRDDKSAQPEDWRPLPDGDYKDWVPLKEKWVPPEALQKVRDNSEIVKPLSNECAKQLYDLWTGKRDESSCGHATTGHFHCYPITTHPAWQDWRKHQAFTGQEIWWCSSLRNAAEHYSWTTYTGGSFEQLAAALQSAMRRRTRDGKPDQTLVAVACLKILDWGGVRKGPRESTNTIDWLRAALAHGTLIDDLEQATSLLSPKSTGNLAASFGRSYPKFPMNSGSTKLFSAVATDFSAGLNTPKQDVLIFDGRVTTALGLIARELSCPNPVPVQFLFPYDNANKKRNSRCLSCAKFPRIGTKEDAARAEYARTASRCIQQALGQFQPSADFVSAEKALFMIGYDVQNTCSGSKRVCHSSADKTHPRPRKPRPRAPAAVPVPANPNERQSETLGQGADFSYAGTPETGTNLHFGNGQHQQAAVSAAEYAALRAHFRGMRAPIGASRTRPPIGSLGAWLKENLAGRPAIASYVAPILIEAGWATRIDNQTIQFV